MGVYTRRDSPYFWLLLERPGLPSVRESTKIPCRPPTTQQRTHNRHLAETRYHQRLAELVSAAYQLPGHRATRTVREHLAWYRTHLTAHKRGRVRETEILATLEDAFGSRAIDALTKADVQEWMTSRRAEVSPATVNRELDVLKHVLVSAVPTYLPVSPIAGLRRLRGPKTEPRLLARDEETRLLKVLDPPDQAIITMALDTLMRLSDIVNLKRAQDHGSYLTVLDPKVDQYRVPVSRRLRKALDKLPTAGAYYFPHRRRAVDPAGYRNSIKSMLQRACKKANIPYGRGVGLTFHALRHTGATRMLEAGVDLRTVQELGGWSSLRQLTRYTHPSEAAKKAAVERVGRRKP